MIFRRCFVIIENLPSGMASSRVLPVTLLNDYACREALTTSDDGIDVKLLFGLLKNADDVIVQK